MNIAFDQKLQLMSILNTIGFDKVTIAITLHRMEIFSEEIGTALFETCKLLAKNESVENKTDVV